MKRLTKRQWIVLQQALVDYNQRVTAADDGHGGKFAWDAADGDPPTGQEVDALAEVVGDMPHDAEPDDTPMRDGKPYITDPDKVLNALLLTDAGMETGKPLGPHDDEKLEKAIAGWTDDQRAAAFEWAALSHLHASDNDDVVVPECPPHVEELRPKYGTIGKQEE